jgi:hypothetical protein
MDVHTGNDEERPGICLGLDSVPVQAAREVILEVG